MVLLALDVAAAATAQLAPGWHDRFLKQPFTWRRVPCGAASGRWPCVFFPGPLLPLPGVQKSGRRPAGPRGPDTHPDTGRLLAKAPSSCYTSPGDINVMRRTGP